MARKHLKHREFTCGERNLLAAFGQGTIGEIEREIAELEHFGGFGRRARQFGRGLAAQYGVNARDQFTGVERLGQIVVRAHFEANDAVDVFALGGEHDDRCAIVAAA